MWIIRLVLWSDYDDSGTSSGKNTGLGGGTKGGKSTVFSMGGGTTCLGGGTGWYSCTLLVHPYLESSNRTMRITKKGNNTVVTLVAGRVDSRWFKSILPVAFEEKGLFQCYFFSVTRN